MGGRGRPRSQNVGDSSRRLFEIGAGGGEKLARLFESKPCICLRGFRINLVVRAISSIECGEQPAMKLRIQVARTDERLGEGRMHSSMTAIVEVTFVQER